MTGQSIGVGIIGANPDAWWAANAHVPAVAALPNFRLTAVSTTRQASADAGARAFGAAHAFASHEDLVSCPDVDLVVVTVRVPHHYELVAAAIEAGKDVYCEWPLGRDQQEGERLARAAKDAGVRTVVGLQARSAPGISTVRDLIAAGDLGQILSTTMVGATTPGDGVDASNVYMADRNNGANTLTIPGGHSMDALCYTLGEFHQLHAVLETRVPVLIVNGTGEKVHKTSPDQVAVVGRLKGGAVASVHVRENLRGHNGFVWDINGTEGTLRLTAPQSHPGFYPLTVKISRAGSDTEETLDIDPLYGVPTVARSAITKLGAAPAANVARNYARYAEDLVTGGSSAPGFDDAVVRHCMISTIEASGYGG